MKLIFSILLIFLVIFPSNVFAKDLKVNISENGFSPKDSEINLGDTIIFENVGENPHWPASNPHPAHTIYSEFDPQAPIEPGKSWSFTFNKPGYFKFHDHLNHFEKGSTNVTANKLRSIVEVIKKWFSRLSMVFSNSQKISVSLDDFKKLPDKERYTYLNSLSNGQGVKSAWKYLVETYSKPSGITENPHDLAHFSGSLIYQKEGLSGLSTCDSSFAFGCYHGFVDEALSQSLEPLKDLAESCENVGKPNSGPWASCIHGLGHGVATYFEVSDLKNSLTACEAVPINPSFCWDGVFMEFATNANPKFFEKIKEDPLLPCSTLEEKYKATCARSTPRFLSKYISTSLTQTTNICHKFNLKKEQANCLEAVGLDVGIKSQGNVEVIKQECGQIKNEVDHAFCISAAAGELVFENLSGWQQSSIETCNILKMPHKEACLTKVNQLARDYRRNEP